MADYLAITKDPLPPSLHGSDGECSIRTLADRERISIEDYFSKKETKIFLSPHSTAVIVPQDRISNASLEDVAVLIEFAIGVLSLSGFAPVTTVAALGTTACTNALLRNYQEQTEGPTFPKKLVRSAGSTWIRHLLAVRGKVKGNLHITADRFVRYLRVNNSRDALLDLCISLESLIESTTEISFRFAVCLAKISAREKDTELVSELLSDLYDLRSKVVHGTDFTKEHKKVLPNADKLRQVSRAILTEYVLYMTAHTKDEWKKYLRNSLLR